MVLVCQISLCFHCHCQHTECFPRHFVHSIQHFLFCLRGKRHFFSEHPYMRAQACHFIRSALTIGNLPSFSSVYRGHAFSLRIKSPLINTWIFLFKLILFIPIKACHIKKSQFCRIPDPFPFDHGIIAERTCLQKEILLTFIQHTLFYHPAICIIFLHRHLIFCQGSRFVRADHIDCSQSLHRGQFSDNGICLHHS